jgi:hypothetical protein
MEPELASCLSQLEAIENDARDLTAGLADAQFNWRPEPRRWSIAQCLSHLTVMAHLYFPKIGQAITEAQAKGLVGRGPFHHTVLGNWFIRALEPPPRFKVTATGPLRPVSEQSLENGAREFQAAQDQLRHLIRQSDGLDLARVRLSSPATSLVQVTLGQSLVIMLAHERRHLWQARQVKGAAGFPRA